MPREITSGTSDLVLVGATSTIGEAIKSVQRYKGPYAACWAGAKPKGTPGTGDLFGYIVESSTPSHQGDLEEGELVINWEWAQASGIPPQGASLPPDTDGCRKEQIDLGVEKTAYFAPLRDLEILNPLNGQMVNLLGAITVAVANTKENEKFFQIVINELSTTNKDLAIELRRLIQRGVTHKRIWTPIYTWKSYHWILPGLNGGGWCTSRPSGPNSWALPFGFDWLQTMDEYNWTGAHYEVNREWIGISNTTEDGGDGGWEPTLYPHR